MVYRDTQVLKERLVNKEQQVLRVLHKVILALKGHKVLKEP
jgi:hypothetical protein